MLLIFQKTLLMMLRDWMPQLHMLQTYYQLSPLTVWFPSYSPVFFLTKVILQFFHLFRHNMIFLTYFVKQMRHMRSHMFLL